MRIFLLALALLVVPGAAEAGPIAAAIGFISTAIQGSAFLLGIAQAAVSFGLSLLAQKLLRKEPDRPGAKVDALRAGENVSASFVVGRWAVGGHFTYHGSHGRSGGTPNVYYQRVIELGDLPGVSIRAVIMNGRYVQFSEQLDPEIPLEPIDDDEGTLALGGDTDGDPPRRDWLPNIVLNSLGNSTADYGYPANNPRFANMFWLKWFDGYQDFADLQLVDSYGGINNNWTENHIGAGLPYAVLTWAFDPDVWQGGVPDVRFVLDGIPLYDPRGDTSVGGDGAQRWDDPTTWAQTANPIVIAYNVARGITLPDGQIYGGTFAHEGGLPLADWVAAMNVCDQVVNGRLRYRFGAEVRVAEVEPAALLEACADACQAQYAVRGRSLYVHAGAPAVSLFHITDDDISASDPETMEPIRGLAARHNAISATYIDPRQLWEPANLPPILNAGWEAEDGGRRLMVDLQLAGVFNRGQARDIARSDIADERRQRQHQFALPPEYARAKCLNTISWTSARNGYNAKLFEVTGIEQRTDDLFCIVNLRERDPDDYDFDADPDLLPPVTPPLPTPVQAVPGFAVARYTVQDGESNARRPALRLTWNASEATDVRNLRWRARVAGTTEVIASGTATVADGDATIEGVIPGETYEVRARLIADRATEWTDWLAETAPDVRLGRSDIVAELQAAFDTAFALTDGAVEHIDGVVGDLRDSLQIALGIDITSPGSMVPDVSIPRLGDLETTLSTVQMQLATAELLRGELANRVRDAGVYVDPTDASVKIRAVNALEDRANAAEIRVDGIAAQVSILAQSATFDDEGLLEQFNEVSALFDALNAEIELRASTLRVDGVEVSLNETIATLDAQGITLSALDADLTALDSRLSTAELQISAIDGVSEIVATVEAVQQLAADDRGGTELALATDIINGLLGRELEREARAAGRQSISAWISDEGEARAQAVQELQAEVETAKASIVTESSVRASADAALTTQVTGLNADVANNAAAITAESVARANADGALAGQISSLTATVGGNSAAITAESVARANADEALAGQISSLTATVGDNEASIDNLAATRVTAAGAVAAVNQEISAEYNGLSALASATSFAEATAEGIKEGHVFRTGGGGLLSLITVKDGIDGPPLTTAKIRSDYIRLAGDTQVMGDFLVQGENIVLDGDTTITGDFVVTGSNIQLGGQTTILNGFITNLTSDQAFIDNLTVKTIESDNYAENSAGNPTAGFQLDGAAGTIKAVDVISRSALQQGSVSDLLIEKRAGTFRGVTDYTNSANLLTMTITGTQLGEAWTVSLSGMHQINGFSQNLYFTNLYLQRRIRVDAGEVYSNWVNVDYYLVSGVNYRAIQASETLSLPVNAVQYRIWGEVGPPSNNINLPFNTSDPDTDHLFRDLVIIAQRVNR